MYGATGTMLGKQLAIGTVAVLLHSFIIIVKCEALTSTRPTVPTTPSPETGSSGDGLDSGLVEAPAGNSSPDGFPSFGAALLGGGQSPDQWQQHISLGFPNLMQGDQAAVVNGSSNFIIPIGPIFNEPEQSWEAPDNSNISCTPTLTDVTCQVHTELYLSDLLEDVFGSGMDANRPGFNYGTFEFSCEPSKNMTIYLDGLDISRYPSIRVFKSRGCYLEGMEYLYQDCVRTYGNGQVKVSTMQLSGGQISNLPSEAFCGYTDLKVLDLSSNKLNDIDQFMFKGLLNLDSLYLANNSITYIHPEAFFDLVQLKTLDLNTNLVTATESGLFNRLVSLQHLRFNNNHLSQVTWKMFDGLYNLQSLQLEGNKIIRIHQLSLSLLKDLRNIRLANNQLTTLQSETFKNNVMLERIYVSYNNLTSVSHLNLPNLELLYLNSNQLEDLSFLRNSNLSHLKTLHLSDNKISGLDVSLSFSNSLKNFFLEDNKFTDALAIAENLTIIFKELDKSNNLHIYLSGNNFPCKCVSKKAVVFLKSLLTFPNSSEHHARRRSLRRLVDPQTKVRYIFDSEDFLESARFKRTPMQSVVTHTNNGALHLHGANVCHSKNGHYIVLNETNFSKMSNCSYVEKLNAHSYIAQTITTGHIQETIPWLVGVAIILLLSVIIMTLLFKKWESFVIWLIVHDMPIPFKRMPQLRSKNRTNASGAKVKKYDLFVSYSSQDEDWVVETLVPELRKRYDYERVCLYYKDFPPGEYLSETIIRAVEDSNCTLLVLSDNFLRSEYCKLEFKKSHHQKLLNSKHRCRSMLAVTRGDPKEIISLADKELKFYLATNIYLECEDGHFWHKLFISLPLPQQRREDHKISKDKEEKYIVT